MTKHYKLTLTTLALLLSALMPFAANAQLAPNFVRPRLANEAPAPKVVFIGDWVTYSWTGAFAANPNWVNQGTPFVGLYGQTGDSVSTAARFQADVVALHPAIVHIMVGSSDANEVHDSTFRLYSQGFLLSLTEMVQEAKAADIQVVLGLEPTNFAAPYNEPVFLEQLNSLVANYGAVNNIPVINYGDALCGCVGSTGATGIGSSFNLTSSSTPYIVPDFITTVDGFQIAGPGASGYALMTQMAEATINTLNAKLAGGYLQNIEQANTNEDNGPTSNVNTVYPGAVIQFTPYGYYSNGLLEQFLNSNFAGSTGTWASSNPLVMYVSQKGLAWALSPGTAIITYTSPTGVKFSEWIMYIHSTY
jgi:lysophospholipase L1-like esterase